MGESNSPILVVIEAKGIHPTKSFAGTMARVPEMCSRERIEDAESQGESYDEL